MTETVLDWWQLPDNAPLGVVRQVAQRNALVAIAARASGDRVEVAAVHAIGAYLVTTRDPKGIVIPKAPLARQKLIEPAMVHAATPVSAAVVLLWQEVMAGRRAEWEAGTAAIVAKWNAPAAARGLTPRRQRSPAE